MRLIDAYKLKEKMEAHKRFYVSAYGGFEKMPYEEKVRVDEITSFIADIVNAATVEVPTWIPVTERLPDSQTDVLVVAFWHERWQTMIGWHSDSEKIWRVITPHGEREPCGVTHLMPLPDAPMTEDNNG